MTITQILYEILDGAGLSVPTIYAGSAAGDDSASAGLLTFFQLPGTGVTFADGTSVVTYQIDVWHEDIYTSEEYKEEAIKALLGLAGVYDGKALIFNIESDNGVLLEDDTQIYHQSFTITIKYARR